MKTMMGQVPAHMSNAVKTLLEQARLSPWFSLNLEKVGTPKIVGAILCVSCIHITVEASA